MSQLVQDLQRSFRIGRGAGNRPRRASGAKACYSLEPSSSTSSTLPTTARNSSSGNAASFRRPAYKRSSWRSDIESRSTPPTHSSERGRCSQRRRISAARGSETARSRKPRSISASLGGSRLRRVARPRPAGATSAGVPIAGGCRPPTGSDARRRSSSISCPLNEFRVARVQRNRQPSGREGPQAGPELESSRSHRRRSCSHSPNRTAQKRPL